MTDVVNLSAHPVHLSNLTVWPSSGPGIAPDAEEPFEGCPDCLGQGEWYSRYGMFVDVCRTCGGRGYL